MICSFCGSKLKHHKTDGTYECVECNYRVDEIDIESGLNDFDDYIDLDGKVLCDDCGYVMIFMPGRSTYACPNCKNEIDASEVEVYYDDDDY